MPLGMTTTGPWIPQVCISPAALWLGAMIAPATLAETLEKCLQGRIRQGLRQERQVLLHIQVVARVAGKDEWNFVAAGKGETEAAAYKRMMDVDNVHLFQKVAAARIHPNRKMVAGVGDRKYWEGG